MRPKEQVEKETTEYVVDEEQVIDTDIVANSEDDRNNTLDQTKGND